MSNPAEDLRLAKAAVRKAKRALVKASKGEPRKFSPGRPPLAPGEKRERSFPMHLTPVELERLDSIRGEHSRSDYLACAAGLRAIP